MTKDALRAEINKQLEEKGSVVLVIEGPCGAGKSTLAKELAEEFSARVFHADDYFLRPEQRTPERLSEIGGNFDRERFAVEVARPAKMRQDAICRNYSCSTGTLSDEFRVEFASVTVIEGSYCMHPELGAYYDMAVFLTISPDEQSRRIMQRNGPVMHKRFMEEWIPMENRYFEAMQVPQRCGFVI